MSEIKNLLKDIVENTMIPEVEEYLNDLHKLLEKNDASDDDMEAIREMEFFLVELENILLAIKEEKINDIQAREVYEKILKLIEESKEH